MKKVVIYILLLIILPLSTLYAEGEADSSATTNSNNPTIHQLIENNSSAELEAMLTIDLDLDAKNSNGETALHIAVQRDSSELVRLLLLNGANPDLEDNDSLSPLDLAILDSKFSCAEVLVANEANIYPRSTDGLGSIELLLETGSVDMLDVVINEKNIDSYRINSYSIIQIAVYNGDDWAIETLLSKGADLSYLNGNGERALDIALSFKDSLTYVNIASDLIKFGSPEPRTREFAYFYTLVSMNRVDYRFDDGRKGTHLASNQGHLGILKYLNDSGSDLAALDDWGNSPLHLASSNGYSNIVNYLLAEGLDANQPNFNKSRPIHNAIGSNNAQEISTLLIQAGASVNEADQMGYTVLHTVAEQNMDGDLAQFFVDNGAIVNSRNFAGDTPLHIALRNGNQSLIVKLLSLGSDIYAQNNLQQSPCSMALLSGDNRSQWFFSTSNINLMDNEGNTPLHMAVSLGSSDSVLQDLIIAGAEKDAKNRMGLTPMAISVEKRDSRTTLFFIYNHCDLFSMDNQYKTVMYKILSNNLSFIEEIIDGSEDFIFKTDARGKSALFHAIFYSKREAVQLLINKGSDINATDFENSTPLHEAIKGGSPSIVGLLINAGAIIDSKDNSGNQPIHEMSMNFTEEAVSYLISAGANVNSRNNQGETPLHKAVKEGNINAVRYLLSKGAEVDAIEQQGWSPLFFGAEHNREEIMKMLVDNGAIVNRRDNDGNTILHIAVMEQNREVSEFLLENGVDIFAQNNSHNQNLTTPFSIALNGGYRVLSWFLNESNINSFDNRGNTPLHYALDMGANSDIIFLMIDKGADKEARNYQGDTPLVIAEEKGYSPQVIELLQS